MTYIYILLIVADLGPHFQPKEYSKPILAYAMIDDCKEHMRYLTDLEDKSYISYRCQELRVVR